MTNVSTMSKIDLKGPGLVAKGWGQSYGPGEFRKLRNCFMLDDGTLTNRFQISPLTTSGGGAPNKFTNVHNIVGVVPATSSTSSTTEEVAVVVSDTEHRAISRYNKLDCWAQSNLPKGTGGSDYHYVVGVFRYSTSWYWITQESNAGTIKTHVYKTGSNINALTTNVYSVVFTDLTDTIVVTKSSAPYGYKLANYFIHKDRLWLVFPDGIYYSKVTDPTIFASPDGGYFSSPGEKYNYAFALSDSIYICGRNSVSVFTYAVDIATDGYLRTIANRGAHHGCTLNGNVYIVSGEGIHVVSGSGIQNAYPSSRVSLPAFSGAASVYGTLYKIVPWAERYLVVLPLKYRAPFLRNWYGGNIGNPDDNIVCIDTINGSVSNLYMRDRLDIAATEDLNNGPSPGWAVDIKPMVVSEGTEDLAILTSGLVTAASPAVYEGYLYRTNFIPSYYSNTYDTLFKSDSTQDKFPTSIIIQKDIDVDGNEYLFKKFRNLLLMGHLGPIPLRFRLWYDSHNPVASEYLYIDKAIVPAVETNPPFAYRFPLNQRARGLYFFLESRYDYTTPVGTNGESQYDYTNFLLSEMHVFWSYTKRMLDARVGKS